MDKLECADELYKQALRTTNPRHKRHLLDMARGMSPTLEESKVNTVNQAVGAMIVEKSK